MHAQFAGLFGRQRTGPRHHAQSKGVRPVDHLAADAAHTHHAQRLAVNAVGLGKFLFVPLAGAQGGDVLRHAPVHGQKQRIDQLGHRDGIFAGTIADKNAAAAGRLDINRIDTGAGAQHQRQLGRGLQRLACHLFAAHHQDFGRGRQCGQCFGLGRGLVIHFAAKLFQFLKMSFRKRVGNQCFHVFLAPSVGIDYFCCFNNAERRRLSSKSSR